MEAMSKKKIDEEKVSLDPDEFIDPEILKLEILSKYPPKVASRDQGNRQVCGYIKKNGRRQCSRVHKHRKGTACRYRDRYAGVFLSQKSGACGRP